MLFRPKIADSLQF